MQFDQQLIHEFGNHFTTLDKTPEHPSLFDSERPPSLSINDYYNRIIKHTECDMSVIHVMWTYLKRIVFEENVQLHNFNIHRLISQAFNLAYKFVDDDHVSIDAFCLIVGYTKNEFIRLEHTFIQLLHYNCMVGITFQNFNFV